MPTGIKVLFVDHKTDMSHYIKMFPNTDQFSWESSQVKTALEALEILDSQEFDVVVMELDLPDRMGAEFVVEVAETHPGLVRFVLSDCTNRDITIRTAGYVHQFVAKPCEGETLGKSIANSLSTRKQLADKKLHSRIAAVGSLPSPPEIYNKLVQEVQSEDCSMRKVANLISGDVGITAKLLQMVNSAFFGLPKHVESPLHAVNMLGLDTVQSMVLTAGVFQQFDVPDMPGMSVESIHNHSVAVGGTARLIATAFGLQRRPTEEALMAGMLHDVGKLVMLVHFRNELKQAQSLSEKDELPLWQAQKQIIGVSDAEIGSHLLSLWGLPDSILEAVALHYSPTGSPHPMLNVLTSVHLAYALNYDQTNNIKDDNSSALDMDYLNNLNLGNQIDSIRNLSGAAAM